MFIIIGEEGEGRCRRGRWVGLYGMYSVVVVIIERESHVKFVIIVLVVGDGFDNRERWAAREDCGK